MLVPLMNATFTPPLTRHRPRETIRNLGRWGRLRLIFIVAGLSCVALGGAGCATPGPNHLYVAARGGEPLRDIGPQGAPVATVASNTTSAEAILGLAYDFNTDHLFLRLAPGNVIRVVERPSGRKLRDMMLPQVPPGSIHVARHPTADLAIRPSDRHLFLALPDGRSIAEITLLGERVSVFELKDVPGPIGGLAYDHKNHRLLALLATAPARIGAVSSDGSVTYYVTLSGPVLPISLGYDCAARHYYVPLADGRTVGVFDENGHLVGKSELAAPITALDAGPRSFLRVF